MPLEILYQDEFIVAINKPHGLLVHRSSIAAREDVFALQLLRDQIGQKVFPVHRLDRKTSGVLLFALSPTITKTIQSQFVANTVKKEYIAIVRGFFPIGDIHVNYDLTNDKGVVQHAITDFKLLQHTELPIPLGRHQTSRYSLIQAMPQTGRMHQIRKHLNHLRHPIIGDRPHGCSKQNRLFKQKWDFGTMTLHAYNLTLNHPVSGERLLIQADFSEEMKRCMNLLLL